MHKKSRSKPPPISLVDGLARIDRESGGLLRLEIIGPRDHIAIVSAACGGDCVALSRMRAIIQSAGFIETMARDKPATCLCCPGSVIDPFATLALLSPATDTATVAVCSAICPACSAGPIDEALRRAAAAYAALWPGLRCVDVTHPEGGWA